MNTTRTSAAQSPVTAWGPLLILVVMTASVLLVPQAAAAVWSTTGWRPADLSRLVDAYSNLFYPEQVAGSGMAGPWFAVTVIVLFVLTFGGFAVIAAAVGRRRAGHRRGFACGHELDQFSAAAMVREAHVILGESDRDPSHSGLCLGRDRWSGREVWVSKETTVLVLAPPRAGKTTGVVAPAIVDHHGPVVATGVRTDIMRWTRPWRAASGPMWLCEPMRESGPCPPGVNEVRWSPLSGCTTLLGARLRAEALFSVLPKAGGDDQFWRHAGTSLLSAYLLAAAASDQHIGAVVDWIDQDTDRSPVDVLKAVAATISDRFERDSLAATAGQLESAIGQDPRYKAGVTGQALQAIDPFRLPAVRRMCDVSIADSFDADQFLQDNGTIWLLGSVSHQAQSAGVCTALTASIVEAARARALREPEGRLRPPLLLALDEAVNVAPIPRLDQLLSTGGGSGIQTMVVVQSMAAARNVWGKEMGDALQDFNNVKVVLGGLADAQDLQDISTQLGMRDEMTTQTSQRAGGLLGISDYSHSWRQVPVMTPADVRMIDSRSRRRSRKALVIARGSRGILVKQPRIFDRPEPATNKGDPQQ